MQTAARASQEKKQESARRASTPESNLLEITREFRVPVDQLFKAFTRAPALKIWWWPKDLYADQVDIDFREGGRYFINLKGFEGGSGGMTGQFEEIVNNRRIVMTDQFADENGNPISAKEAKMAGTWPELVYITFEFDAIDENTSRFKLSQQGIPNEMQKDCIRGWSQSFDKLEKYLNLRKA